MEKKRRHNRLDTWLYNEWLFFVTICTQDKFCYFGSKDVGIDTKDVEANTIRLSESSWNKDVGADTIRLSRCGEIVKAYRCNIPTIYDKVSLDNFVIMPNHIHGILCIDGGPKAFTKRPYGYLSKVIKWFKWAAQKALHEAWFTDFHRQRSFYDHIIRNDEDLQSHQNYIELNPYARKNDEYYR